MCRNRGRHRRILLRRRLQRNRRLRRRRGAEGRGPPVWHCTGTIVSNYPLPPCPCVPVCLCPPLILTLSASPTSLLINWFRDSRAIPHTRYSRNLYIKSKVNRVTVGGSRGCTAIARAFSASPDARCPLPSPRFRHAIGGGNGRRARFHRAGRGKQRATKDKGVQSIGI